MLVERFDDGIVILGTFPEPEVLEEIRKFAPKYQLTVADPPYGNVVREDWDKIDVSDKVFAEWMFDWTNQCAQLNEDGGALMVWGGTGIPGFRPFYRYASDVENRTPFTIATHVTWGKKRAYGISWSYLFCREECLYLVKGDHKKPRVFNIPLLEEKRGYAGYSEKYPAKSEYKRRTNVWSDITEIFSGKLHECQKPDKLYEVIINTHSNPGDYVLDPFSGSGTTAVVARKLGRKFVLVENDPESFEICLSRIRRI